MKTDQEILDGVLGEFTELSKYPRSSHHEKAVSDYLVGRLRKLGLNPIQDEVYNIVADQPATAGYEHVPLTILQGHMDMVCVAEEGKSFNPLTDPIVLKRDGDILSADGTTLGADDGVAEAVSLYLLTQDFPHGPLRHIFTVDEETGMTGAIHLDPKYVKDAKYIINCDSEEYNVLTVGSAGSAHTNFKRSLSWQTAADDAAICISISGLLGGHSGESINDGKASAIKTLGVLLQRIAAKGVSYRIANIDGGAAANAIPAKAEAVLVIDHKDAALVREAMAEEKKDFDLIYGNVETGASFMAADVPVPAQVFSDADTRGTVQLLCLLHVGVFAMNQTLPKLPDMSANIGTIQITDNVLTIQYFPRSSKDACLRELTAILPVTAELTGFDFVVNDMAPAWTENPHSVLAPLMAGIFKEQNGTDMRVEAIHGGLETGYFFAQNPDLDIVSVGPTTKGIHSPQEILVLSTVAPLVKMIVETLKRLK